jgi:excinuclease ABC subunit C
LATTVKLANNGWRFMDERLQRLSDKAKTLPKAPGVYLMKDEKGDVIYIGKSASLRDRVCSYAGI